MDKCNHINYPDNSGRVYCKSENDIVELDWDRCSNCIYFNGDYQGSGVECLYEDTQSTYSDNPSEGYNRNNPEQ